jgi:predicted Zn-dependent protease
MQQGEWDEARRSLERLDQRFPQRAEIVTALVELYYRTENEARLLDTCERLSVLRPNDADVSAQRIAAAVKAMMPMKALQVSRQFLERWPGHARAGAVRRQLAALEEALPGILEDLRLPEENGVALALLHEEARAHLVRGHTAEARAAEERLLEELPDYAPAWNNIAQCLLMEGDVAAAVSVARHVVQLDPDNIHALGNLARFLWLTGQPEEARAAAARLRSREQGSSEIWHKKAETFSLLGEDAAVLEAFRAAEASGRLTTAQEDARLYHLAAVAALRLDDEAEAQRLWGEALRRAPGLESARHQREDLRRPVGERQTPWVFSLAHWLLPGTYRALAEALEQLERETDPAAKRPIGHALLEQHPELVFLIPHLLDRGDAVARQVALRVATTAATTEMLAALREFGFGRRGPDTLRFAALRALVVEGELDPGLARVRIAGAWRITYAVGFFIHRDPVTASRPREVSGWVEEARSASAVGRHEEAERLLRRALEREPEAPEILTELAAVIADQGGAAEAAALRHRTYERFPASVMAQVGQALVHLERGEQQAAQGLLDAVCRRRMLHMDEFGALADAQLQRFTAQGDEETARDWFGTWSRERPMDHRLARWRGVVAKASP